MDLLSILASVAASMVGFTGLLTAFRANSDSLSANDVTNIRILLIFSVSALVFALLPLPFLAFETGMHWLRWLTGALGAYFLFWSIQSPVWMSRHRVKPRSWQLYWTMIAMQALVGIVLLAGALVGHKPLAIYTVGVLWALVTAVIVFVAQIFVMLPVTGQGEPD